MSDQEGELAGDSDCHQAMAQRAPLIVVLGATACGKSRLAIELARRFNGEIISADSMQVYKGLDIVTNKVTNEEQKQARHHMINFLDPMSRYSVIDFRNKSLEVISELHKRQQVPIVVGGTNYYIESLLWKSFILGPTLESAKRDFEEHTNVEQTNTLIDAEFQILKKTDKDSLHQPEDLEDVDKFFSKPIYNDAFADVDDQKLWDILEKVDPEAAHAFHPRDKRRVIRSLQVIQANNKNYSDMLKDVNKSAEGDRTCLGGPLRYPSTLVIWLNCDYEILDKMMDDRVDKMLERGLLAELEQFHDDYNKQRIIEGKPPQYDKGIFQTIGFKEFHDYFMLDTETRTSEKGKKQLEYSVSRMKITTRQYARRQLKWIRRRFLQSGTRDLPPLFKLNTAFDEDGWLEKVQKPAYEIVSCFMDQREYPNELLECKKEPEKQEATNLPAKHYCEACSRTFIGSYYIESHLKSKQHGRMVEKQARIKKQKLSEQTSNDDSPHCDDPISKESTATDATATCR